MRLRMDILFAGVLLSGTAMARVEPGLPVWDADERVALEEAGWVAGGLLLTDEPVPDVTEVEPEPEIKVAQPTAEEMAPDESESNEIPEAYWPVYFGERPESFLVDPQGLLSPVDFRDRQSFLEYHSGDSSIDLFIYVFRGDQELPGEVREEELVERFFSEGRPAAVVYYFLGSPQRSVIYLSPSLTDTVSAAEQRRALESSVMQAFEKVDPAGQIEAFLVQMSIRIYWMERMQEGGDGMNAALPAFSKAPEVKVDKDEAPGRLQVLLEQGRPYFSYAALFAGGLICAVGVQQWFRRKARYHFPEFDVEPRLGGDHAAGVGAVISFASASLPPASQRDQVPDYLRRA